MNSHNLFLSTIDANAAEIAGKYGFGLEIAEYCTAMNMDETDGKFHSQVLRQIQGVKHLVFHGPFSELFPCAIDPKARQLAMKRFTQASRLAQSFGIHKVVFHGGFVPNVYYPCWYVEQSICFWKDFLKDQPEDMIFCVENVMEQDPAWMRDIARGVEDPRLRLCLDVGHANVCSSIPVEQWLDTLAPWLAHFHIHNNDGSADTHSPLCSGKIPIASLLCRAQELCPDASFTLEVLHGEQDVSWLLEQGILEEEQ